MEVESQSDEVMHGPATILALLWTFHLAAAVSHPLFLQLNANTHQVDAFVSMPSYECALC